LGVLFWFWFCQLLPLLYHAYQLAAQTPSHINNIVYLSCFCPCQIAGCIWTHTHMHTHTHTHAHMHTQTHIHTQTPHAHTHMGFFIIVYFTKLGPCYWFFPALLYSVNNTFWDSSCQLAQLWLILLLVWDRVLCFCLNWYLVCWLVCLVFGDTGIWTQGLTLVRCYEQAGGVEESKFCLFSVLFPVRCISSVSPRFYFRRHAFCFLLLAAIL
jgi:hypothetical protein